MRAPEQLLNIDIGRARADLGGDFPLPEFFSLAQSGMSQREPDKVIGNSEIFRSFGYAIWREIFVPARLEPITAQPESTTHDAAAAPVERFSLIAQSRE